MNRIDLLDNKIWLWSTPYCNDIMTTSLIKVPSHIITLMNVFRHQRYEDYAVISLSAGASGLEAQPKKVSTCSGQAL